MQICYIELGKKQTFCSLRNQLEHCLVCLRLSGLYMERGENADNK